jgi:hypothetical protein
MERLPVELVARICWHLCPHCQSPDHFPNADTDEALLAKASLARLARVSKSMCAIAQPFVFHYYATGNLPSIFLDGDPGYPFDEPSWPQDNDQLPYFLRSVIDRPDLAKCIRALQLVTPSHYDKHSVPWHKGDNDDALPAIQAASAELGLMAFNALHPDYEAWACDTPGVDSRPVTGEVLHHILEQLAILLCPNVSTLLLAGTFGLSYGKLIRSSERTLPALKTIALLSQSEARHYAHSGPLLTLAPNLETIYAADLRESENGFREWAPALEGTFAKLQSVHVHDLGVDGLRSMVRSCPELRELHYTHTVYYLFYESTDCQAIATALEPVRKTLRRLSIEVLLEPEPFSDEEHADMVIESLGRFENLEELTVHQGAVHVYTDPGQEEPLPGGLAGFLPRSIVAFHITQVYQGFAEDLYALARDAPSGLPHLRSVIVSCIQHSTRYRFDEPTRNELQDLFEAVGISLSWGENVRGEELRLIPGLPIADGILVGDVRVWTAEVL